MGSLFLGGFVDQMLAMYCKEAEERGAGLLTPCTIRAMDCSTSAGLSADEDSGSEHEWTFAFI